MITEQKHVPKSQNNLFSFLYKHTPVILHATIWSLYIYFNKGKTDYIAAVVKGFTHMHKLPFRISLLLIFK